MILYLIKAQHTNSMWYMDWASFPCNIHLSFDNCIYSKVNWEKSSNKKMKENRITNNDQIAKLK